VFVGSTSQARVSFIAPAPGAATITCVEDVSGVKRFHNRTLSVAQATSRSGSTSEQEKPSNPPSSVYDIGRGGFVPSGWMGDGERRNGFSTEISEENPHTGPNSRKWIYRSQGAGWGGVAF
jgi:hypothetical protein